MYLNNLGRKFFMLFSWLKVQLTVKEPASLQRVFFIGTTGERKEKKM